MFNTIEPNLPLFHTNMDFLSKQIYSITFMQLIRTISPLEFKNKTKGLVSGANFAPFALILGTEEYSLRHNTQCF